MTATFCNSIQLALAICTTNQQKSKSTNKDHSFTDASFRIVKRENKTLKYTDDISLNAFEAYIAVRYGKADVWTKNQKDAQLLASFHSNTCFGGDYFTERDKEQPTYFYHTHLKINNKKINSHIFFGTDGYGRCPS